MTIQALINSSGLCVNSLNTNSPGATLISGAGESVINITEGDFNSGVVGKLYADGVFSEIVVPPPPPPEVIPEVPPPFRFSKVDIMRRITPTEWAAFNASTDPMAVYALAVFNATGDVDPSDPLTVQLFGALESMGILAAGRAAQILA